jgi:iron complex outermembrane receptor protein
MSTQTFKKGVLASSIAMILAGASSQAMAAEEATSKANKGEVEVIQVTGIRGSLKENINGKRFADSVVDIVSSEDIGKFPDKNVADSLARIPGITVSRDFGEGGQVSIRGTSPDLTLTTLNGQKIASTGWFVLDPARRSFNFELMPAEAVAGLEVYKSPQAKLQEGGIGGLINMKTRKPLDMDSMTMYGGIEAVYSDLSGDTDPAVSGLISWKNDEENLGLLVAAGVSQRHTVRQNGETYWSWGAGMATFDQERERTSIDVTAQWVPTDGLDLTLHYFNTELEADNTNTNVLIMPGRGANIVNVTASNPDGVPLVGDMTTNMDPSNGFDTGLDNYYRQATMVSETIDLAANYEGDSYTVSVQVGSTKATGGTDQEVGAFFGGYSNNSFDLTGESFSYGNVQGVAGLDQVGNVVPAMDLLNADTLTNGFNVGMAPSFSRSPKFDEENYFQLDVKLDVDLGAFESVDVGFKYRDHETGNDRTNGTLVNTSALNNLRMTNFVGGSTTDVLPETGKSTTEAGYLLPDMSAFANFLVGEVGVTEALDLNSFGRLQEDITALYTQGNFSGEGFRGNVGVRYVRTETTGTAHDGTSVFSEENTYDDWLPSLNVAFDVTDDVIVRGAASRVISRPTYTDLMPTYSGANEVLRRINQGNIALDPYRANQYDLGLEWYFTDASLISGTFFYKDISSFTTTQNVVKFVNNPAEPGLYNVTLPVNGSGGTTRGFEFQVQHDFGNGFGSSFNYTYSDAKAESVSQEIDGDIIVTTTENVQLPGNSKHSMNVSGFYESDMFSTRVSYNWRDEFIGSSAFGAQAINESRGYLDASFTYHVTENIDVSIEGVNLLSETEIVRQSVTDDLIRGNFENGARYYFNAKFRF